MRSLILKENEHYFLKDDSDKSSDGDDSEADDDAETNDLYYGPEDAASSTPSQFSHRNFKLVFDFSLSFFTCLSLFTFIF